MYKLFVHYIAFLPLTGVAENSFCNSWLSAVQLRKLEKKWSINLQLIIMVILINTKPGAWSCFILQYHIKVYHKFEGIIFTDMFLCIILQIQKLCTMQMQHNALGNYLCSSYRYIITLMLQHIFAYSNKIALQAG